VVDIILWQAFISNFDALEITASSVEANTTTNDSKVRYLYNAYRVGMLAMDLLGKRIDEDRSYVNKFSQVSNAVIVN
jgi:hypothetical protein